MDENHKIIKSQQNPGMLIDRFSEIIKHEINKLEDRFLSML